MGPEIHPESAWDYLDPAELRAVQLRRLHETLERCYARVAVFRQRMEERGLQPADVQSLEDVAELPFMQKTDLRDNYPFHPPDRAGACEQPAVRETWPEDRDLRR